MRPSDPYLPLRDLVCPLANSYATLRQQRLRSGELVEEVDQLGELAKRLLCQLGLDSIEEAAWLPVADDSEATFAVWMAEAYGDARTAWEDLLVAVDALAERWINADERERVEALAVCLDTLGLGNRAFVIRRTAVCQPMSLMLKETLDDDNASNFRDKWSKLEDWVRDHQDDKEARKMIEEAYGKYIYNIFIRYIDDKIQEKSILGNLLYSRGEMDTKIKKFEDISISWAEYIREFNPNGADQLLQFIKEQVAKQYAQLYQRPSVPDGYRWS